MYYLLFGQYEPFGVICKVDTKRLRWYVKRKQRRNYMLSKDVDGLKTLDLSELNDNELKLLGLYARQSAYVCRL